MKKLLDAVIEHSHMHDEIYEQVGLAPPRGILLAGPSGTGKTAMARALSGEKQLPLIAIDGPQLYSKWLGESERALREVFKKARRAAPCILFFDTIDAIAPKFGAEQFGSDVYQRILSQLLREIDNLRDVKGVILVAATNRPERIEPALLRSGRFDYIVPFAKPDAAERAAHYAAVLPARAARARCRLRRIRKPDGRTHRRRYREPVQEGDAAGDCRISESHSRGACSSYCAAIFWRFSNPIAAVPSLHWRKSSSSDGQSRPEIPLT